MKVRHKVFISYHHYNDQFYRDLFERLFAVYYDIIVSKSVQIGDIESNLLVNTVRQKIRDEYLGDSTVTVVLVGTETWKRKHVDWEISSSIRNTSNNPRSGLLGILLPTHESYQNKTYNEYTVPPRLCHNQKCGFANIYNWNEDPNIVGNWINLAFHNRFKVEPDNSYPNYVNNRSGERWY
ncbi:MAG: TIR domain-containing protein [candidate division Zixibacteria bacterium]|nr:TIR domain-containing protein [candidate division Zixibacteria bacterium]